MQGIVSMFTLATMVAHMGHHVITLANMVVSQVWLQNKSFALKLMLPYIDPFLLQVIKLLLFLFYFCQECGCHPDIAILLPCCKQLSTKTETFKDYSDQHIFVSSMVGSTRHFFAENTRLFLNEQNKPDQSSFVGCKCKCLRVLTSHVSTNNIVRATERPVPTCH